VARAAAAAAASAAVVTMTAPTGVGLGGVGFTRSVFLTGRFRRGGSGVIRFGGAESSAVGNVRRPRRRAVRTWLHRPIQTNAGLINSGAVAAFQTGSARPANGRPDGPTGY